MIGSWDNARRHPARTVLTMFVAGALGGGAIGYFGPGGERDLHEALASGLVVGATCAVFALRTMKDEGTALARPLRSFSVFGALVMIAGLALLGWGVATSDWGLAGSGLPFLALGAGFVLVRYLVSKRQRRPGTCASHFPEK